MAKKNEETPKPKTKAKEEPKFEISQLIDDSESITSLSDVLTRIPKKGWKPNISKLAPAIVDGKFVVPEGERVIIEYTQEPSRDTAMWIVSKVFETVPPGYTVQPGYIRLYDPEKTHFGGTNYKDADKYGLVMKIPDKSRRWTPGEEETLMQMAHKRRRRKKKFVKDDTVSEPKPAAEPGKKKRGRPKGSKNKTTLEREARAATKRIAA